MTKKKLTAYISGPMTGMPDHGFPAFMEAEKQLKLRGYDVLNPARNDGGSRDKSWAFYMRMDVQHVAKSDIVVLLNGWERSKGAQLEVAIAERLEIPIYLFSDIFGYLPPNPLAPRVTVKATMEPENIAEEAIRLVCGDRNDSYGHPLTDYQCTAGMQSAIVGAEITPKQAILNMIAVKISRESRKHKRDNLVDICGYALCLAMVEQRLAEENS
jgi:hypothetical protein